MYEYNIYIYIYIRCVYVNTTIVMSRSSFTTREPSAASSVRLLSG